MTRPGANGRFMGVVLVVSALVAIALLSSPVGAAMSMAVGYHGDCSTCEDNGHVASGPRAKRSAGGSRDTAAVLHGELASSNGRVYALPQLRPVGDLFAPNGLLDTFADVGSGASLIRRVDVDGVPLSTKSGSVRPTVDLVWPDRLGLVVFVTRDECDPDARVSLL